MIPAAIEIAAQELCTLNAFAWSEAEGIEDAVSGDGDKLVAVDVEGYGIGANGAAGLEIPQRSAGARVERVKVAFI